MTYKSTVAYGSIGVVDLGFLGGLRFPTVILILFEL